MFFNTKPKKKTLIEEASELVAQSQGIKSVFSTMKTNLEEKNIALGEKSVQIDEAVKALQLAQNTISTEAESNDNVVKQINKILGE